MSNTAKEKRDVIGAPFFNFAVLNRFSSLTATANEKMKFLYIKKKK